MKKILWQIVQLLWKFLKVYFWKWLRPYLGKIVLGFLAFLAVIGVIAMLLAGSC